VAAIGHFDQSHQLAEWFNKVLREASHDLPAPEATANRLAPAQWNLLAVHIGPSDVQRVDAAFPDAAVDFSRGDVPVTVQVELAGAHVMSLEARDVAPVLLPEETALRLADMRKDRVWPGNLLRGPLARLPH